MFVPHDEFEQLNDDAILWRYQDVPRYLDLLLKKELFFCRIDKFEDPFEGRFNKATTEKIIHDGAGEAEDTKRENVERKEEVKILKNHQDEKRTSVTVSSWHRNESENFAMWKIYAKGTYGLAIQTTYERLKHAFDVTEKPVYIGKVNYYDEREDIVPFKKNSFLPFLCKRRIYSFENEVRCCYALPEDSEGKFNWEEQDKLNGVFIPVDLNTLIEKIYISPYSPEWIKDIVTGLNEKFEIDKEIVHSTVFDSGDYI